MSDFTPRQILTRMSKIVSADRLIHGQYLNDDDVDSTRAAAICGGHKACAIGSLWLAAGVKPEPGRYGGRSTMPSASMAQRDGFLAENDELAEAYHALNEAADDYMCEHNLDPYDRGNLAVEGGLEILFETHDAQPEQLLTVIADAKSRL